MSVARIVGHTVKVEPKTLGTTDVYFVEGAGAAGLHADCVKQNLVVSPLVEGSFHVTKQTVLNEWVNPQGTPLRDYICTGISDAALGKGAAI